MFVTSYGLLRGILQSRVFDSSSLHLFDYVRVGRVFGTRRKADKNNKYKPNDDEDDGNVDGHKI